MLKLTSFWFSFPEDNFSVLGFGVTAYSIEEAYSFLEKHGYSYHKRAKHIEIKENIIWDDLEVNHVRTNVGPMTIRGIWFPNHI